MIDHFEISDCEEHFGRKMRRKALIEKEPFPQYERLIWQPEINDTLHLEILV